MSAAPEAEFVPTTKFVVTGHGIPLKGGKKGVGFLAVEGSTV